MCADLEPPKLFLFSPVIECCDKNNNNNSQKNGQPLDPVRVVLLLAWTRITLNYLNADSDLGIQTNADPHPGQTLKSQK